MTENIRPFFLISLGLHLFLIILLFLMKGPRVTEVLPRRVVIEFSQRSERTLPAVAPEQAGLPDLAPQELAESLKMEGPKTLAIPGMRSPVDSPQPQLSRGGERLAFAATQEPLLPQPSSPAAAPFMPAQLLARELESPPAPAEDGGLAEEAGNTEDGGYSQAGALEWRGRERKLLKTAGITFPDILLEEGLEVDVVAVFTVAANGQVIEVEIVRSSGYATVDTAVQRALYSYLFEPSGDSSEDVGQIQVRFRLERGD
jgi:TonB family protein